MTQILLLPLLSVSATTGNNEDWLDSIEFTKATGTPIDLTSIAFSFEVRATAASPTIVFQGDLTSGLLTSNNVGGILAFIVKQSTMINITPATYVFDIVATGDGYTRRCVTGTLTVVQGVTR